MADTTTSPPDSPPDLERLEREWREYVADLTVKRTVSDDDVRRGGIAAVHDKMEYGHARVRGADGEWYIVMTEARFREYMDELESGAAARVRESEADYAAGRYHTVTSGAEALAIIDALPDEDEPPVWRDRRG